jgi:hypothetical protein
VATNFGLVAAKSSVTNVNVPAGSGACTFPPAPYIKSSEAMSPGSCQIRSGRLAAAAALALVSFFCAVTLTDKAATASTRMAHSFRAVRSVVMFPASLAIEGENEGCTLAPP